MTTPRATEQMSSVRTEAGPFPGFVPLPENRSGRLAIHRLLKHLQSEKCGRKRFPILYLHGNPGSGKTHLLQALLGELSVTRPGLTVKLITGQELNTELSKTPTETAASLKSWQAFDLLAIEDMQFFSAQHSENLVNLLDHRQNHSRCTVLNSAPGPAELAIPNRLVSRLVSGVVVHLESLSPASRKRFIQQQCEERTLRLHTEVVEWLTQRGPSLRELLGELNRLDTLARFSPPPLRLDVVLNQSPETESESKPEKLIHQVAAHFDVPIKQLKGKARHRNILWPRQVAIYLLREMLGLPLVRIGSFFGGRDHTTVMHAIEKVKAVLGEDAGTAQEIRKLRAVLQ